MKSTGKSASNAKSKLKYRTWEHPAGSGIRVAEIPNKTAGKQYGWSYQVRVPAELTDGNRELHQRSSKEDAERLAEDRFVALKKLGTSFADVPAEVQRQVSVAWSILKGHNTANGTTLGILEVIKAGIRTLSPAGGRKTVSDVIAELTASKKARAEAGGLDGSTLHDFTVRSSRIADTFGPRFVSEIQHTEITEWLEKTRKTGAQFGGSLSARSVKNYRNTLSEIFRHATARQYCAENPFDRFTREDLKAHGGDGMARDLDGIRCFHLPLHAVIQRAPAVEGIGELLGARGNYLLGEVGREPRGLVRSQLALDLIEDTLDLLQSASLDGRILQPLLNVGDDRLLRIGEIEQRGDARREFVFYVSEPHGMKVTFNKVAIREFQCRRPDNPVNHVS